MADAVVEETQEQETAPGVVATQEKPAPAVTPGPEPTSTLSDEMVRKFAGLFVRDELMGMLGESLREKVANARKDIQRQGAKLSMAASLANVGGSRYPKMAREQCAEWLRCALDRQRGVLTIPHPDLDGADKVITQALTPITGSAGAYLLPDEFASELEKRAAEPTVLWPLLQKRTTSSRHVLKPEVTAYITPNKGSNANVNSATSTTLITATEPVFSEQEWYLEDFDARMPVKLDLIEESPINVYDELMALCADGYAIYHESLPLIGQGHGHKEPSGLMMGISGITTVAVSAAPTVDNMLDFYSNVPQRYRTSRNVRLVVPSATFFKIVSVLAQNVTSSDFLTKFRAFPEMLESAYIADGKALCGDFSRYVVYSIRLLQVITGIVANTKTQEIIVTETWTGHATQTDAFRIATGITYT